MSDLGDRLDRELQKLKSRRDELRVQLDLGKKEAGDAWQELEGSWAELEGKVKLLARESKEAADDIGGAAELLLEEVKGQLKRLGGLVS